MSLLLLLRNSAAAPPPETFSGGNASIGVSALAILRQRAGGETLADVDERVGASTLTQRSRIGIARLRER